MSLRKEQCTKVCKILDDVLANRPTERDSLIAAVRKAFDALDTDEWIPIINDASDPMPEERKVHLVTYETLHGRRYVRDLQASYVGETPRYIGWSKKVKGKVIAWRPLPEPWKG